MWHAGRWVITVGLTACLLTSTQSAVGEVKKRTDRARDVIEVIDRNDDGRGVARLRPRWKHGDIRSLRVDHARRVHVALRFRNINPKLYTTENFVFRTGRGKWSLSFDHTGRHIERFSRFWYNDARDAVARCRHLRIGVNAAEDRVRVSVPRPCIGHPRWVRVGATTWGLGEDDALRRGRNDDSVDSYSSPPPALGPRVFRGPSPRR
jgi:hypothetical protein